MTEVSSKERLVLLALQADASGLTHSQLTAVTSLGWEEVEQCVQRLEDLERAYHIVDGAYTFYFASPLPDEPVSPRWEEWLAVFCEAQPQLVDRDRLATMYASCGVVLLAALVGGTTDPERISRVTTLPLQFVSFVLALADSRAIWDLDCVFELHQRLRGEDVDFADIEKDLHSVKENFWDFCWTPAMEATLHELRERRQFGGKVDSWTEAEDVDGIPEPTIQ